MAFINLFSMIISLVYFFHLQITSAICSIIIFSFLMFIWNATSSKSLLLYFSVCCLYLERVDSPIHFPDDKHDKNQKRGRGSTYSIFFEYLSIHYSNEQKGLTTLLKKETTNDYCHGSKQAGANCNW